MAKEVSKCNCRSRRGSWDEKDTGFAGSVEAEHEDSHLLVAEDLGKQLAHSCGVLVAALRYQQTAPANTKTTHTLITSHVQNPLHLWLRLILSHRAISPMTKCKPANLGFRYSQMHLVLWIIYCNRISELIFNNNGTQRQAIFDTLLSFYCLVLWSKKMNPLKWVYI